LKASFEPEVAEPLLECYLQLARGDDANALGLQLAEFHVSAGENDKAVETLSRVFEYTADPGVEQRRAELTAAAS